jgi:hypothetical protein
MISLAAAAPKYCCWAAPDVHGRHHLHAANESSAPVLHRGRPGLASYLSLPAAGDRVEDVLRLEGFRPGPRQLLLSAPGTVGIISSALLGATVALAAGAVSDSDL